MAEVTSEVDPFPRIEFRCFSTVPSPDDAWGRIALVYDDAAFTAITTQKMCLRGLLLQQPQSSGNQVVFRAQAPRATTKNWNELAEGIRSSLAETLICVGGGTCVDASKWVAAKTKLHLVGGILLCILRNWVHGAR